MSIWDVDDDPRQIVKSKVRNELCKLENHPDFTVTSKDADGISLQFDGGNVELGLPQGFEYSNRTLVENIVILRLLYVSKEQRSKGIGTEILKKVLDAYKDSPCAMVIYPIPVELQVWTNIPQMVQDLELQKRLILFYERAGFKCLSYSKLYNVRCLVNLFERYQFKKLTPSAMGTTFKQTPKEVVDEIKACTVTSEEMFKDVTEKLTVPELTVVHLMDGRYVI